MKTPAEGVEASQPACQIGCEYSGFQLSRYRPDYATRLKRVEGASYIFGLTVSF